MILLRSAAFCSYHSVVFHLLLLRSVAFCSLFTSDIRYVGAAALYLGLGSKETSWSLDAFMLSNWCCCHSSYFESRGSRAARANHREGPPKGIGFQQGRRVRNMIDQITTTTNKLVTSLSAEDKANARKDEIAALGGQTANGTDVLARFMTD
ncbi:hypothetical protein Vadar_016745 [Vaccinium darrowii]|uniref:Uncharacterized protein n=1 Tax=Vaccinium darrowii TaxID=229202 RepID=A0ACB7YPD0_9ERIC|nr:hypothetical protein Vadar_016745 [Vaccinium darrowii]